MDDGLEISGTIFTDRDQIELEINPTIGYANSYDLRYGHFIYKIKENDNPDNPADKSDVKWLQVNESTRSENNPINAYTNTLLELSISGSGDLVKGLINYESGNEIMNEFTSLTEINVLDGITRLTDNSFKNTTSLKNIILPTTLTEINTNVFENCISLTNIELPSSLTKISENSFSDCTNLEVISYSTGLTGIDELESIKYFTNDYDINVLELNNPKSTELTELTEITNSNLYKKVIQELGGKTISMANILYTYTTIENEETVIKTAEENIDITTLDIVHKEVINDGKNTKKVIYLSHGDKIIDWFMYNNTKFNFEYDFVNKKFTITSFDSKDFKSQDSITNNTSTIDITDTNYNKLNYNGDSYTITHQLSVVSKLDNDKMEDKIIKIFDCEKEIVKFYIAEEDIVKGDPSKYLVICSNNEIYLMHKLKLTNEIVNDENENSILKKIQCSYRDKFGNIYRQRVKDINITYDNNGKISFKITVYYGRDGGTQTFKTTLVSVNGDTSNKLTFKMFKGKYIITNGSNLILWMYVRNNPDDNTNPIIFSSNFSNEYNDNEVIPISRVVIENNGVIPKYNTYNDTVEICSLKLPNTLTSLNGYNLKYCRSLSSVELPTYNFKSFSDQVFMDCQALTSIEIPSTLTGLGASTFCQCRNLQSVIIPSSITKLESNYFAYCDSISSVTIFGKIDEIDKNAKEMFYHQSYYSGNVYENKVKIYLKHNHYYDLANDKDYVSKFEKEIIYKLTTGLNYPSYEFHLPKNKTCEKIYSSTSN